MPYQVKIVDGRVEAPGISPTWRVRMDLPFESGSWSRKRNGGAGGQITVNARHEAFKGVQRLPIWPWQSWVVIEWRPGENTAWSVIYAGVITDASYNWSSKKITISHEDLWSIFDRRIVTTDRTNTIATSKVTWSNLSAATMIKRIIQNVITPFGSPLVYDLPIILPADVSGSESLTVYGYSFEKAAALIRKYIETENGPDIDFRPHWTASGTLGWVMDVNANKNLVWDYDLDAEQPSAEDMDYVLSGSKLTTKVYGAGEGSERRTLVRQSDHDATNYLAIEDSIKLSGFKDLNRLQAKTTGDRQSRDGAIRQMSMKVRADGSPRLSQIALGGSVRWKADKDPWLVSGWHEWEVTGFSGNLTDEKIQLVTQEMEGRSADL